MGELRYRGYVPGLDILRGLAISLVLLYHGIGGRVPWQSSTGIERVLYYLSDWGASGVHLFYVLSGFLITGIIVDSPQRPGFYKKFYFNRAMRILPAYVLMLAVLKLSHVIGWRYVLACILYIANMAGLVGASNAEYGAFWSLAVEEQFYLVWPWIARNRSLRTLAKILAGYCVLSPFLRALLARFLPGVDIQYKLWGNAEWLMYGALVAVSLRIGYINRENIKRWIAGLAIAGILAIPLTVYLDLLPAGVARQHYLLQQFYRTPIVMIYLALLLYVILRNRGKEESEKRGIAARFLAFLGYISYGVYLCHPFIFEIVNRSRILGGLRSFLPAFAALFMDFLVGAALSIAIAYLSRRFFEEQFLRLKNRFAKRIDIAVT